MNRNTMRISAVTIIVAFAIGVAATAADAATAMPAPPRPDATALSERAALRLLAGNLLKPVKGSAGAVAKSDSEFKKWAGGLPWYVKGPLAAAGLHGNLHDVRQLFH